MHTHEDVPDFSLSSRNDPNPHAEVDEIQLWIESLTDFSWSFDFQFRPTRMDPRVSARMLQQAEDMMGRSAWELFPELANTLWGEELRRAAVDRTPRRFEFFHPEWKRWLDCRIFFFCDQVHLLAIDMTPRKNLEIALQGAVQELESFSYSITHDMRAPLRAMQSFARILQQDHGKQVGPEGRDYIRRIIAASERLDRLIQDALAYSQFSRASLPLAPVDLGALVNEILESYPEFQSPHASVVVSSPLPVVQGNPAALTQCLANLIDNGIKFSKPDQRPEVEIAAQVVGGRARIQIRDHGIGIDPTFHEKIFNMFYQHDPSYAGSGIGLVVVRKAAEKMNGRVSVESEPGRGSVFYLELNLADTPWNFPPSST